MKAIIINQYGNTSVLEQAELPMPKVKSNEVLIEIHACALNPIDFKIRSGIKKEVMPITFPFTPGCDVSGVIRELGSHVQNFKIGDEVYFTSPLTLGGGYAEFCTVKSDLIALKPKRLSHIEAASLPIIGLTTIQALRDYANLKAGHKILIHAGAGGVGSFAIQFAKAQGAIVYTTASKSNHQYLYSLGADYCIDYQIDDFLKACDDAGKMDVVFETIGGLSYTRSILATKPGGVVPCIVNPPDDDVIGLSNLKKIKTGFVLVSGNSKDLETLSGLINQNKVKPCVSKTIDFTLDNIKSGHQLLESGHCKGKVVIQIK